MANLSVFNLATVCATTTVNDKKSIHAGKQNICKWNENELNRLGEKERQMASALFKTVLSVLGGSLHKPLVLTDNYFFVGGNSLNAVAVVTKLRDQGFFLGKLRS